MYRFPYPLWSIWPSLSWLNHLFVLVLVIVSIYSIFSAVTVLNRIRILSKIREDDRGSIPLHISKLNGRCANLRHLLGATFFLFGFLFFLGLPNATVTIGDGRGYPFFEILNNFVFEFVYAANVFLVLFVLYLVQWVTSSRVRAWALRLGALPQG